MHRKLNLKVEDLDVTSYETMAQVRERGTVHGRQEPQTWYTCWNYETPCCTADPAHIECAASDVYCSEIEGCWATMREHNNYGCGSAT